MTLQANPETRYKTGRAKVLGTMFLVHFSEDCWEYAEGRTQTRLNELARDELLCKLNEVAEVQNPNALVLIETL